MKTREILPYLFLVLMAACSGAGGPAAPIGGNSIVEGGTASVGQHAAGPGAEEVLLGPGAADPNEKVFIASMNCEFKCETSEAPEAGTDAGKDPKIRMQGHLTTNEASLSEHTLRIVEHLYKDGESTYQDINVGSDGDFNFSIEGSERRDISVYLIKSLEPVGPLNKILPCPEDSCRQPSGLGLRRAPVFHTVVGEADSCIPLGKIDNSYCQQPIHLPLGGQNLLPNKQ